MDAGIVKRGVVLTRRDAHCPECGGVGCIDVPSKKIPAMENSGS